MSDPHLTAKQVGDVLLHGAFFACRFAWTKVRTLKRNVQNRCWLITHPSPCKPEARLIQHAESPISGDADLQQSSLLMQLPYDVRIIIWKLVFTTEQAEDVLHLDLYKGSVQAKSCINDGWLKDLDDTAVCCKHHRELYHNSDRPRYHPTRHDYIAHLGFEHPCWDLPWTREDDVPGRLRFLSSSRKRVLPFLQTCKQIYSEALPFACAGSVYDVRSLECLVRLPQALPVRLLHMIKHIRFSTALRWPIVRDAETMKYYLDARGRPRRDRTCTRQYYLPPDDARDWTAACMAITSMQLQSLSMHVRVYLRKLRYHYDPIQVDKSLLYILEPLKEIQVADFRVILNLRLSEWVSTKLEPSSLPYTLTIERYPSDYTWEEWNESTDDAIARRNNGEPESQIHTYVPTNQLYLPQRQLYPTREERMLETNQQSSP